MTNELRRVKRAGDAWETVSEDESGGGGGTAANVAPLQYVEWGPSDTTKTLTFAAGTVVYLGFTVTDVGFDQAAVMNLGFPGQLTALMSGGDVDVLGRIWTVNDLNGGSLNGIGTGFPITNDSAIIFPAGGQIVGTLDPQGAAVGRVRFYFLACVPSEAETT